jgi:hypothetical protein
VAAPDDEGDAVTAPQLTAYVNGPIAVSADQLNTFMQTCDNAAQMRGLIGVAGMSLSARGIDSVNDGLGGDFYWNSTSAGPDDNMNTTVPTGVLMGAWIRTTQSVGVSFASPYQFGAIGNGTTDDTAAVTSAYNEAISQRIPLLLEQGAFKTTTPIIANNVAQEVLKGTDHPTRMGLFEGSAAAPDTLTQQPIMWVQKYTKFSSAAATDQAVGGVFTNVQVDGSGSSGSPTLGAWIGSLTVTNSIGSNVGTSTAPAYDQMGDVIGVAGFARASGVPGSGHIITGTWSWAEGPTIDATTFAHLPAQNWSICGHEINLTINSPDVGVQTSLIGNGSSVGLLCNNYRTVGAGIIDWTFGHVLAGTPNDGNYSSTDIADWNGFHTGYLIDKIRHFGIQFGYYLANTAYGIAFQSNYAGMAQRAKAGIYMGDSQINMGNYLGSTFNPGDLWCNTGRLYFQQPSGNCEIYGSLGVGTSSANAVTNKIHVNIGGTDYYLLASTSGT